MSYSITNLPPGFEYDASTFELFNSVNKKTVLINPDGMVTISTHNRNLTLTMDEYVNSILFTTTEEFKNRRNRIVEPFIADVVPINFPIQCNHLHFGTCLALALMFCTIIIVTGILLANYI